MLSWSRPDPLTRDLIHLINARRHDHGDTDAAIDTLQAFIEQGREQDLLTVLAALDEEMAEWMFDLVAEASCAVIMDGPDDEKGAYALMAALELPLQANLGQPLGLKIDPVATADLLHRHLQLPSGVVVRVEPRLLTDATLEGLTLQALNEHLASIADSQRTQSIASRLYPPVENTAFLFFQLIGMPDPGLPDALEEPERRALLEGLVAQCAELALAPDTLEVPVYAAYALFDAQNAVRLHRLADETAAVWRDLDPMVRARTIAHLHTQCGNGLIRNCPKIMVRCGHLRMSGSLPPIYRSNGRAKC
jgi:hypothetical protein